jgi:hypothetical protein
MNLTIRQKLLPLSGPAVVATARLDRHGVARSFLAGFAEV